MKKTILLTSAVLMSLCVSFPVSAGQWKQNDTGVWYQNDDGTNPAASWKQINGKWYYFKHDGYMNTGWIKVADKWYYCEITGEMRTSDLQTDVFTFKFNIDGSCSNFYDNTTPSVQAGWASYGTTSLPTFVDAIASGNIIYYGGQYWGTPDYANTLKNETVVYFHDISSDSTTSSNTNIISESDAINRYTSAYLNISDNDSNDSTDLDGIN